MILTRISRILNTHTHRSSLVSPYRLLVKTMSSAAVVSKLQSPLRDLVLGATQDGSQDFGKSEKDKAEVAGWIEKVAQGDVVKPEALKVLDVEPRA